MSKLNHKARVRAVFDQPICIAAAALLCICLNGPVSAAGVILAQEDFNGITGFSGSGDPRINGVPVTNGSSDSSIKTIGNSDLDWYAARFEVPDGGAVWQDVGAQKFGGGSNNSIVGKVEDDAGLLLRLDTTGYTDIMLDFDWRTFSTTSNDRFVVGYFIGDLLGIASSQYDAASRSFDLRNADHGGSDGAWNWSLINGGGNTGDWVELLRDRSSSGGDPWQSEWFSLAGAENGEVWIAFWLDNGEGDFGKFDNVIVQGTLVPVPAAVWLFGSALSLLGWARRKTA